MRTELVPISAFAGVLSCALTYWLILAFKRRAIFDLPNERSLHTAPVPRGGGWAIFAAFAFVALIVFSRAQISDVIPLIAGTILLLLVSWWDDLKNLSQLPRFGAQIVAVILGLSYLHGGLFKGYLPAYVDYPVTALAWLWFINLFNFMDGMDGLAGGEAAFIGIGLFLAGGPVAPLLLGVAVLGFLVWNWSPAKIFLGDVGSIPLGYVLGFFLIETVTQGRWAISLLLPLYFLVDASLTLLRRLLRREKIWQAHREHAYQTAVQNGRSHAATASGIMLANAALLVSAVCITPFSILAALIVGALTIAALFAWLYRRPA
jgi:UDP-N-acetylmuramyl pentapeptide phosphotransferase/UDP-N-acetylglucosamine-1-phosphate transferase